jgi:hypothetical protein
MNPLPLGGGWIGEKRNGYTKIKAHNNAAQRAYRSRYACVLHDTADVSLRCWAAHAAHGNNYNIIKKMYEYYRNLWRDANV